MESDMRHGGDSMAILGMLKNRNITARNNKTKIEETKNSGPQLSQWLTFGDHFYRRKGEVAAVEFINEEYGIRKLIVDDNGYIQNYPGLEKPEEWLYAWESKRELEPQICFRTDFYRRENDTILMVWEIQPDGRYWEDDDGFGAESDLEIQLYTYLDKKGNFTAPFRAYKIGTKKLYHG